MKTIVLFVAVAVVFLGTGVAYGLGGGGHSGDGRADVLQKPGANPGSTTNAPAQDTGSGPTGPSGTATRLVEVSVLEPATLLLLGSGLIGLVGLRKKFRK